MSDEEYAKAINDAYNKGVEVGKRDLMRDAMVIKARADAINEIYEVVDNMYYSTETRNLNDLEYGFNQGLGKVQDFLEQLKEKKENIQ